MTKVARVTCRRGATGRLPCRRQEPGPRLSKALSTRTFRTGNSIKESPDAAPPCEPGHASAASQVDQPAGPARWPSRASPGVGAFRAEARRAPRLQPGDRNPERRAGDVVQPRLVEE